jgi:hypothetical protein
MASPKVASSGVAANCLVIAADKSTLHSAKFARALDLPILLSHPSAFCEISILMAKRPGAPAQ